MMRLWQPACDDCGAVGKVYRRRREAIRSARYHRCDNRCAHCGFAPVMARGLCSIDYRNREIRVDYENGRGRPIADLIEDVEWLLDDGARLTTILARLEMKRGSLHRALTRAGRLDLYWRAADREDDAEMRRKVSEANRRRRAAT